MKSTTMAAVAPTKVTPAHRMTRAAVMAAVATDYHLLRVEEPIIFPLDPQPLYARRGDTLVWDSAGHMATLVRLGESRCEVVHRFIATPDAGGAAIVGMLLSGQLVPFDRETGDRILNAVRAPDRAEQRQ